MCSDQFVSFSIVYIRSCPFHIYFHFKDRYKIEDGKINCTFTIALEADFDEEVMEVIECMEDEVAGQGIIFQTAME